MLLLYGLLAVLLTWPLVIRLTTHVPGVPQWAFDESTFVWNIWYFKHALIDNLRSPLQSELIWYPLGIDLVLYTYNFYHVLAALPLALGINLPFASNISLLASTILSGYGAWLLFKDEGRRMKAESGSAFSLHLSSLNLSAFVVGVLFAFACNRAVYAALGHYDMVTTQWIPFYALGLLRILDGTLPSAGAPAGGDPCRPFLCLHWFGRDDQRAFPWHLYGDRPGRRCPWGAQPTRSTRQGSAWAGAARVDRQPGILGLVAFVAWAPALIPILLAFRTANFDLKGWGDALSLSADLLGWFTPTVLHPLLGGNIVEALRQVQLRAINPDLPGFRDLNTVFLGWTSLALAVTGAFAYRRKVATWIWTSILFGIFTLGPLLQINGRTQFDLDGLQTTVPLPFLLLHFIPIIKANRAPNRNSVVLMLGLAMLAGYGVYWLLGKLAGWQQRRSTTKPASASLAWVPPAVAVLLAGAIIFEHLAVPIPLSDARVPAVYDQIAADPNPVSVLQLPLGWRNSFGVFGPEQTLLQYYQSAHGKPMLGGNISRAPDFKLDYFQRLPYFQALTDVEFGRSVAPELLAAAKAQAADLAYLYDTGYVILTPPIPERFPYADTWQAAWDFVKSTLPLEEKPFWAQDGIEAYRVMLPEGSDSFRLDLGQAGTFPYRGEGWDATEVDRLYDTPAVWATDGRSRLFVPLRQIDPEATYTISLRVHPFNYPQSKPQSVSLVVNGSPLAEQTLVDDWQEISWQMPGSTLQNGLNRLELVWSHTSVPRTVNPGSRQIGSTGVTLPVDADIKAFADGGFIALFDEAGNQTDASAGRRGVNVTVLDPADWRGAGTSRIRHDGQRRRKRQTCRVSKGNQAGRSSIGGELWRRLEPFDRSSRSRLTGAWGRCHARRATGEVLGNCRCGRRTTRCSGANDRRPGCICPSEFES